MGLVGIYLSDQADLVSEITGLSLQELEDIVGRFKGHYRFGRALRGKLVLLDDGTFKLTHHFTNKVYLTGETV